MIETHFRPPARLGSSVSRGPAFCVSVCFSVRGLTGCVRASPGAPWVRRTRTRRRSSSSRRTARRRWCRRTCRWWRSTRTTRTTPARRSGSSLGGGATSSVRAPGRPPPAPPRPVQLPPAPRVSLLQTTPPPLLRHHALTAAPRPLLYRSQPRVRQGDHLWPQDRGPHRVDPHVTAAHGALGVRHAAEGGHPGVEPRRRVQEPARVGEVSERRRTSGGGGGVAAGVGGGGGG